MNILFALFLFLLNSCKIILMTFFFVLFFVFFYYRTNTVISLLHRINRPLDTEFTVFICTVQRTHRILPCRNMNFSWWQSAQLRMQNLWSRWKSLRKTLHIAMLTLVFWLHYNCGLLSANISLISYRVLSFYFYIK